MIGSRAFFSFTELRDPSLHRAYNEWHQLDHRPENLALPGVAYGERWVRSPDCPALHATGSPLDGLHYLNMYWFREPVDAAVRAWSELADRSLQWGRRPDLAWANRLLMGFLHAVKGYAAERVLVSPDVLPYRPNTGVFLTVSEVTAPASATAEALHRDYDRAHLPAALGCDGVAGAWTFASDPALATRAIPGLESGTRIHLYFLDGDPLVATHALARVLPMDDERERIVYAGPLRAITPWQWDWFDDTHEVR